jgi:hypothetical protein
MKSTSPRQKCKLSPQQKPMRRPAHHSTQEPLLLDDEILGEIRRLRSSIMLIQDYVERIKEWSAA